VHLLPRVVLTMLLAALTGPAIAAQRQYINGLLVDEIHGILASIQFWKPVGVIVATTVAFHDDRAERREKVASLLRAVGATAETPGYAFVVMVVDGSAPRYYPVRLTPDDR
jgi:hypothetical protein